MNRWLKQNNTKGNWGAGPCKCRGSKGQTLVDWRTGGLEETERGD